MRRSVQPNCPRAMTCCFFVSLKMLAMPAEGPRSLPPRQRLERLLPMAVFQVSMYGRFWVSTEEAVHSRLVSHRQPLPVRIDGELNRGVAELPLDVRGRLALLEQQARERVAEAVGREVQR